MILWRHVSRRLRRAALRDPRERVLGMATARGLQGAALHPPSGWRSSVEQSVYVPFSAASAQNVLTRTDVTQGSAVAVTPHVALTNCHVVHKNRVHFLLREHDVFEASVVYGDAASDRCALEIKSGSLQPAPGIRPYATLLVGERVYTVGSPSGLENTLGEGIISGLRERAGLDLVQTSAPISPGSSGGGLFDAAGNLIGITTFFGPGCPESKFRCCGRSVLAVAARSTSDSEYGWAWHGSTPITPKTQPYRPVQTEPQAAKRGLWPTLTLSRPGTGDTPSADALRLIDAEGADWSDVCLARRRSRLDRCPDSDR